MQPLFGVAAMSQPVSCLSLAYVIITVVDVMVAASVWRGGHVPAGRPVRGQPAGLWHLHRLRGIHRLWGHGPDRGERRTRLPLCLSVCITSLSVSVCLSALSIYGVCASSLYGNVCLSACITSLWPCLSVCLHHLSGPVCLCVCVTSLSLSLSVCLTVLCVSA